MLPVGDSPVEFTDGTLRMKGTNMGKFTDGLGRLGDDLVRARDQRVEDSRQTLAKFAGARERATAELRTHLESGAQRRATEVRSFLLGCHAEQTRLARDDAQRRRGRVTQLRCESDCFVQGTRRRRLETGIDVKNRLVHFVTDMRGGVGDLLRIFADARGRFAADYRCGAGRLHQALATKRGQRTRAVKGTTPGAGGASSAPARVAAKGSASPSEAQPRHPFQK